MGKAIRRCNDYPVREYAGNELPAEVQDSES